MGICNTKIIHPKKSKSYELQSLTDHTAGINSVTLNEDESILATVSDDRTIRLWTTQTDRCECIGTLIGHEDYVTCAVIEDIYVMSGSADKTMRKWDMLTGECLFICRGHKSLINRIFCTGDLIFTSSYDRTVRCWNFDTGEIVRIFAGHKRSVYPMVFIPYDEEDPAENGHRVATKTSARGSLRIAEDLLITGSADQTAIVWSFETGKIIHTLKEHTGALTCVAVDLEGRILLTGSTDHTIRSWDIQTGQRIRIFEGHQSSVICMTVYSL